MSDADEWLDVGLQNSWKIYCRSACIKMAVARMLCSFPFVSECSTIVRGTDFYRSDELFINIMKVIYWEDFPFDLI